MARNFRGGKISEPTGGHIVDAGPCRFAKALNFQLAQSLFVFEKPEPGANDFAGVAESAIANTRLNKLFEVRREVDILCWNGLKMRELATIVNFKDARKSCRLEIRFCFAADFRIYVSARSRFPASSSSDAHWLQKYFFHQWFKEYDSTPAAGGMTIVYRFLSRKRNMHTFFG